MDETATTDSRRNPANMGVPWKGEFALTVFISFYVHLYLYSRIIIWLF